MNLSVLIGKPVINTSIPKYYGTVFNVRLDTRLKQIVALEILREDDDYDDNVVLPIELFGNNHYESVTMVERKIDQFDIMECVSSPIGNKCYTKDGEYIGRVRDVMFNNKFKVIGIVVDEFVIEPQRIVLASNSMILIRATRKAKPKAKKEEVQLEPINEIAEEIDSLDKVETIVNSEFYETDKEIVNDEMNLSTISIENTEKLIAQVDSEKEEIKEEKANKVISGYNFLLGRVVGKDIISFSGKQIAFAGESIDKNMIQLCTRQGKLSDLIKYSRNYVVYNN